MCRSKQQGGRRCGGKSRMSPAFRAMVAQNPSLAGDYRKAQERRQADSAGSQGDTTLAAMQQQMRDWRSRPEPVPGPAEPMSPAKAKLLGCDTPEGRARYDRVRAYREAGYTGPLDQDGRISDPDDPKERRTLEMLAALQKT